jgi:hypothetical protein
MSKAFDDLIHSLDEDDMSVLKGFVLSTVRADEARTEIRADEDQAEEGILRVCVTGTLEDLRQFAQVMAADD